jgi:pantothenate kinase type III
MKFWRVLLVAAVAAVVSTGSAWAQKDKKTDKPKMTQEEIFKKLDKNGDGKVTLEEFTARSIKKPELKEKLEAQFKQIEKKDPNCFTLEEFKAYHPKAGKKKIK